MHSAERFIRCMNYQDVDHVTDMEFGYWDENMRDWPAEGMPELAQTHRAFELYFGFEQPANVPFGWHLSPPPETVVVKVEDDYEFYYDGDMVYCRRPRDHHSTMPEHIDYSLKDEDSWREKFEWRLKPDDPARAPESAAAVCDQILAQNEIPQIHVGSMFGVPRNWMGFEGISLMIYQNPKLVETVIDRLCEVICLNLERVLPRVEGKVKWAHFWEDICFNHGPMISPQTFRELCTPRYRQITEILNRHGIHIVSVDCDGDVEKLVDAWLEGGVNTMFPLEQNGGCDPLRYRKQWGRDLRLMGGVDKTKMSKGGDVIRAELERLAPLVAEGGFIPFCDHRVPADVTLEKYREYVHYKRELFGIPHKAEQIRETAAELP